MGPYIQPRGSIIIIIIMIIIIIIMIIMIIIIIIIIILDSKGTRHAYQANPSGGASASASVTPSTKSALACITDSLPMEGVAGAGFGRAQFIYIGPALPLQGASKTRRRRKTPLPCL